MLCCSLAGQLDYKPLFGYGVKGDVGIYGRQRVRLVCILSRRHQKASMRLPVKAIEYLLLDIMMLNYRELFR